MDVYEKRAKWLDDDQKKRLRRFNGTRDEFFNDYEMRIYHQIIRLFRKSSTYAGP